MTTPALYAYVAVAPCGCWRASCVGYPGPETLRDWLARGLRMKRVTTEQAREFSPYHACPHHKRADP